MKNIKGVMVKGEWLSREYIDERLKKIEDKYRRNCTTKKLDFALRWSGLFHSIPFYSWSYFWSYSKMGARQQKMKRRETSREKAKTVKLRAAIFCFFLQDLRPQAEKYTTRQKMEGFLLCNKKCLRSVQNKRLSVRANPSSCYHNMYKILK